MDTLARRRYKYVFEEPPIFSAVSRNQIRGAWAVLRIIDPLIEQLRDFKRLSALGAHLPAGVLFHGPRRIGKTLCARYFASESGARFIDLRRFPRPVVKNRESSLRSEDIRELFKLARKYVEKKRKPVIIFYDEFENAKQQIVEELRIQIDGVSGRTSGIFMVITSSDEEDDLDGGLFNDGRISIKIPFVYPGPKAREDILRYYLSNFSHDSGIDISSIAYILKAGTTPAAIKQYVEDAYNIACIEKRSRGAQMNQRHLLDRCLRELIGHAIDSPLSEATQRIVAYHEAGHAVAGRMAGLPVQVVSVIHAVTDSSLEAHGLTWSFPPEGDLYNVEMMRKMIIFSFGGLIAVRMFGFSDDSAGAREDLSAATHRAQELVEYLVQGRGFSRRYGKMVLNRTRGYSGVLRQAVERDVGLELKDAEQKASQLLLKAGKPRIKRVALALLEKKVLLQKDLDVLLR